MRACFYARVSTEEEKQVNALVKQCEEARLAIEENGWDLPSDCEYIDEGKSGTTIKNRDAYKHLIEDLDKNKFDIIVIKSQDRLMRSAKDWYIFLGKMTDNKKQLYFYIERKFYQTGDSLITGIKAILAEEFNRELSKKLNNANRTRQRNGSTVLTNGTLWGYVQEKGELNIHEEEAAIVRRVFTMYCDGIGFRKIKNILDADGIVSRRGTPISLSTLKRMIRNPVYIGTVIQNKAHFDFDTKRTIENDPKEWYVHENRVPAIVNKEVWEKANRIMDSRVEETPRAIRKGKNRGVYPLSSKMICGECGAVFHRNFYNEHGALAPYWICGTYQQKGRRNPKNRAPKQEGCDSRKIRESDLFSALHQIASQYSLDILPMAQRVLENLKKIILKDNSAERIELRESKREQLQKAKSYYSIN
jgi:DNA invertase Pin-like site-specific DNA recombinase